MKFSQAPTVLCRQAPWPAHLCQHLKLHLIPRQTIGNSDQLATTILHFIHRHQPEKIVLDTFPLGQREEWNHPFLRNSVKPLTIHWLCRLLNHSWIQRWKSMDLSHIDSFTFLEPLPKTQEETWRQLNVASDTWQPKPIDIGCLDREHILCVHGGPSKECQQLLSQALDFKAERLKNGIDLPIVTIGKHFKSMHNIQNIKAWPADDWVRKAHTVVHAGGYNSIWGLKGDRIMVPFLRRFDDQNERCILFRKKTEHSAHTPS